MSFLSDLIDKAKGLLADEPAKPTRRQAVDASWYDEKEWEHTLANTPAIQEEIDRLQKDVSYADEFLGDVHNLFYKVDPQIAPADQMLPSHAGNRDVTEVLSGLKEVQGLRQHTRGDKYATAMAVVSMEEAVGEATERVKEARTAAEQARQDAEQAAQAAKEALEEALANGIPDVEDENGNGQAGGILEGLIEDYQNAQWQAQGAAQAAGQAGTGAAQQAVQSLRKAAQAVDDTLSQEQDLMSAYGVDPGVLERMNVAERIKLAERLRNNRLAQFAKLLGQFKAVQQAECRKRVIDAATEVVGVTLGDDLERMLVSEALNFADENLETMFWLRWTEKEIQQYELSGKENMGQGPIICVVDESGSMGAMLEGGTREAWSKALALSLCDQARRRKRDFVYIGFSSAYEQHIIEFPSGLSDMEKVITMTEHNFDGGTSFEEPLGMALAYIERTYDTTQKDRPDIVFISDGNVSEGSVSEQFIHEFHRVKDKTSIKAYGIAIGVPGSNVMNALCDNVRSINELTSNPREMADIFRTI